MYYPKSQIKTNLYTNGNELSTSTDNKSYSGYYYEISTGGKYTGKSPQDGPNILLMPIENPINPSEPLKQSDINFGDNIILYSSDPLYLQSQYTKRSIPLFNPTIPTTENQQQGQFNRYFCKKTNENRYLEIDFNTYKPTAIILENIGSYFNFIEILEQYGYEYKGKLGEYDEIFLLN
jgi:hypothetical protein